MLPAGPRTQPLAAIIAVFEVAPGADDVLAATRPFAGASVLEHQARRAQRAGAVRLILLTDQAHPALVAVAHRLRREGLPTDVATGLADAADRVHPDEPVLVVADSCLVPQAALDTIAAARPTTLLTVADVPGRDLFERIDASVRWAGVALLDGASVRDTAQMVGEWDPLSVLLRRAVQQGAVRIAVAEAGDDTLPVFAHAPQGLAGMERRLVAGTRSRGHDLPSAYLYPPVEDALLPPLFRRQIDPWWLAAGGTGLAVLGASITTIVPRLALLCLLLSGPMASLADRLALIRAGEIRRRRLFGQVRMAACGVALAALAALGASAGQWAWWLVAGAGLGGMATLTVERRTLARLDDRPLPLALASPDALVWAILPFGVAGLWGPGMGAVAVYALGSFAWVQRRVAIRAGLGPGTVAEIGEG